MYLPYPSSNSTKYNVSNSFHGQTSLRKTIFSVLISRVKLLLIHKWFKKCWWIASYVFSILCNLIHFSLFFKPCYGYSRKNPNKEEGRRDFHGNFHGPWNFQGHQRNSMWKFLHFWNYNPSPNGQLVSFIGAQAHLTTQLVGAEWYKVLKIIHCRISPTK